MFLNEPPAHPAVATHLDELIGRGQREERAPGHATEVQTPCRRRSRRDASPLRRKIRSPRRPGRQRAVCAWSAVSGCRDTAAPARPSTTWKITASWWI